MILLQVELISDNLKGFLNDIISVVPKLIGDVIVFDGHEKQIIKIYKSAVVIRAEKEEIILAFIYF